MELRYEEAASPFCEIGPGKQLRLLRRYSGPLFFGGGRKELRLEEVDEIELKFRQPQSIRQVLAELLVWQSFLKFALRRPSFILELRIRFAGDGPHSFSHLVMVPGSKSEVGVGSRRALFLRSRWGDDRISPWASAFRRLEKAVLLFSGASYQEDAFLHTRLLAYLQALEVYHREAFPDEAAFPDDEARKRTIKRLRSAIPRELDREVRKKIGERLSFVGELSLLERLKSLLTQHRQSIGPLFPGERDMALLRDVRNFLTHYGDKKSIDREFLTSRRLLILCEKTRLFVEACLLGATGLEDGEIANVVSASESYHYWRRQQH